MWISRTDGQTRSTTPEDGTRTRLYDHVNRRAEVVATTNMAKLACQNRLQLGRRQAFHDAFRQEEDLMEEPPTPGLIKPDFGFPSHNREPARGSAGESRHRIKRLAALRRRTSRAPRSPPSLRRFSFRIHRRSRGPQRLAQQGCDVRATPGATGTSDFRLQQPAIAEARRVQSDVSSSSCFRPARVSE
jgi:hypothetical protein